MDSTKKDDDAMAADLRDGHVKVAAPIPDDREEDDVPQPKSQTARLRRLVPKWLSSLVQNLTRYLRRGNASTRLLSSENTGITYSADKSVDEWYRLSIRYGREGQHERAADAALLAVQTNPRHSRAWRSLSVNLSKQPGKQYQALEAWRHAAELAGDAQSWYRLSVHYGKCGLDQEAIEAARRTIELDRNHVRAWRSLRSSFGRQPGGKSDAFKAAERAAELGGTAGDWSILSVLHGKSGAHGLAVTTATRAIEIDSSHLRAWRSLSISLAQFPERKSEALKARRRVAELSGDSNEWSALGRDLFKSAQYRDALDAALRAVALDDANADAWRTLAIGYDQLGKKAESLAAWKRVDSLSGSSVSEYALAAQAARDRVRLEPGSMKAWKQLATAYGRMGRDHEAIEIAEEAFAGDPTIHSALLPLVDEVLNRVPNDVWNLLGRMVDADAGNAHYVHLRGVAGGKAGKGEEAFELMRTAARLKPGEPRYWYALGRALEEAGGEHRHEALTALSRALDLKPTYSSARIHLEQLRQALNSDVAN